MGKQINFYQLQEDALLLFKEFYSRSMVLYDSRGEIIEDYNVVYFPSAINSITKNFVGNYFIGYRTTCFDKSLSQKYLYPSFWKYLIEFIPSRLSMERDGYYNDGRIYLSNELYENKELKLLYDMLVKYIKKTYEYNREMSAYIAPHFMERLKRGEVIPCNSDNPYKLLGQ